MRRAIQKLLEDPLADEILRGKIADSSLLKISKKGDALSFTSSAKDAKKEPESEVAATP